ncbi:hypothetical protein OF385_12270 [Glutamicibacter sp. JL.03c]|uniref:hypothetical protein n=1 Tax=Glutamicibacter sp. JL.03c TaxID=2984842 RepID=UPI0021F7B7C2|nr:hypothetical protein [Glutamicibacter sp. JL.03c]UYQ76788.1 hypothetical protein OF385_12270 [Glutamicibacter sp. JL.03c]
MPQNPATRVLRGWLAASVCTWTAFAAHAHSAPTKMSLVAMGLITCISAMIALLLVGKRFSVWATSLVVMASQGLFHLSLSVMSHDGTGISGMEHVQHTGRSIELAHNISTHYADVHTESMLYAHVLAAVASILVLNQGERLLNLLGSYLTLSSARRILALIRIQVPDVPVLPAYCPLRFQLKLAQLERLPERRGPPSFVLAA